MSGKMKWDGDGQRASVRNAGGERTASVSSMRHDPIQRAGAEIDLGDKFRKEHTCPNKICQMRVELLELVKENSEIYRKRLLALGQDV